MRHLVIVVITLVSRGEGEWADEQICKTWSRLRHLNGEFKDNGRLLQKTKWVESKE